jgi:hypothetical protein
MPTNTPLNILFVWVDSVSEFDGMADRTMPETLEATARGDREAFRFRCRSPPYSPTVPYQLTITTPILSNRTHPHHTIPQQPYSSSHTTLQQPNSPPTQALPGDPDLDGPELRGGHERCVSGLHR